MQKKLLNYLIVLVLGLICGFLLFKSCNKEEPPIIEPDISQELAKIDSLENKVREKETTILALRDSIKNVKTVVIIKKIEEIEKMPLDTSAKVLKENISRYGEFTDPQDTLPQILRTKEDTIVALSENNVKDVNLLAVKYENELTVNGYLEDIIQEKSLIIQDKDSIILNTRIIIDEKDKAFSENLSRLNESLRKQKTEKYIWIGGLSAAVVVLTGILIAK